MRLGSFDVCWNVQSGSLLPPHTAADRSGCLLKLPGREKMRRRVLLGHRAILEQGFDLLLYVRYHLFDRRHHIDLHGGIPNLKVRVGQEFNE